MGRRNGGGNNDVTLYRRSLVLANWMVATCHTAQGITCATHAKPLSPWSTPSQLIVHVSIAEQKRWSVRGPSIRVLFFGLLVGFNELMTEYCPESPWHLSGTFKVLVAPSPTPSSPSSSSTPSLRSSSCPVPC